MFESRDEAPYGAESSECNWAVLAHLSTLVGYFIPFANVVCPLAVMLTKGRDSEFIEEHAREALNFQISLLVYALVGGILVFVVIGIFVLIGVAILDLVGVIMAAVAASKGRPYEYPLTFRLVKG